ncbi:hypothetical protein BDV93DRAFT_604113 [Ceratobasidium sp. AG-I]|nr:hypothetical protein BDV93DRAFT_604113 [Ceratobasidium sp. AG-I]
MSSRPPCSEDEWLKDLLQRMFSQSRGAPKKSHYEAADGETKALQAAKDARRTARMVLQAAITALEAADEQQDRAESLLLQKLDAEKEKRRMERIEAQRQADEHKAERERWEAIERMRLNMENMKREERLQEEAKNERRRRREETERQAAEQETAEALRRARHEEAKAREEAARARQEANAARDRAERAEGARRQDATRKESERLSRDQLRESTAWAKYSTQWEIFKRFSLVVGASAAGTALRFEDIPWPTLTPPTSPSMITRTEVEGLLFSSFSDPGKPLKTKIRDCLLMWHPDKFSGRWMRFVIEADRGRVAEGVSAVARALNDAMIEYANRRRTM